MPVDTTPIFLPIVLFYVAIIVWLFVSYHQRKASAARSRWQRTAWGFLAISAAAYLFAWLNQDVERTLDELMDYELTERSATRSFTRQRNVRFTSSRRESFSWDVEESRDHIVKGSS